MNRSQLRKQVLDALPPFYQKRMGKFAAPIKQPSRVKGWTSLGSARLSQACVNPTWCSATSARLRVTK
jgi:hypothetical protein